ncbi:MAG: C40 family peptidase [Pseudomonadota bacterium]
MRSPTEPVPPLDPRVNAYRPDLAEAGLTGQVSAAAFVEGEPAKIAVTATPIRAEPDDAAMRTSEAIYGERLQCFERKNGWAWVKMAHDGYVGYVRDFALAPAEGSVTHRIACPRALLFGEPDLKAPITGWLPLTAAIRIEETHGDYARLIGGGWTHTNWINPIGTPLPDPVATARLFLNAPYGWGGRTAAGLDCSGLVQVALAMAGVDCPRDSDQQEAALGRQLDADEPAQRGDLVFFPGHIGFMADEQNLLHANATHMAVTIDPLGKVEDTVRTSDSQGRGITSRRRLEMD